VNRELENGRRLTLSRLGDAVTTSRRTPSQNPIAAPPAPQTPFRAPGQQRMIFLAASALAISGCLGGCGMSSLTSGLSPSVFGGGDSASSTDATKVSEEQLLSAAKTADGSAPAATGGIEVATGCPKVIAPTRDNSLTIYEPGRVGDGLAIVHRGEITKTARECIIEGNKVIVKYGFSGRVLLGPRGKAGTISLPVTVFVADSKREKVATDTLKVDTTVAVENPIGYFSAVRIISFNVPEGARAGECHV
jgi:hypothetical protein